MLGLYQVPRPTCIQVSNIGDISEDSLSAYFETKRSGGSGDVDVVIHQDQGCAIVTLDSYESMSLFYLCSFISITQQSKNFVAILARNKSETRSSRDQLIFFHD